MPSYKLRLKQSSIGSHFTGNPCRLRCLQLPGETILTSTVSNETGRVSSMRFVYQVVLFSVLLVSSLARGQEPTKPTGQSGPPRLELKITKLPLWKDNCLTLSVQQMNLSKSPILLDAMYEGIKIYSSVNDATNTLGQGSGEAWMLIYGRTDVISDPIELGPRARRQSTLCIAKAFPVKETGKEALRQVRVQGKLRIVAGYEIPTWRIIDRSQGKGRRAYVRVADNSTRGTFGEVVLEIPIPCPNGVSSSDCLSPPQIFPGEHDVHTFELEPPAIEFQPPAPPNLPIDYPLPPKPPPQLM